MIDLMSLSPQDVERFIHMQGTIERQKADHDKLTDYRDYYYGEHPILLNIRQQEFLGGLVSGTDHSFHHNISRIVIDTIRERLDISGMSVNGQSISDEDSETAALFWSWWTGNRLDSNQARLYRRVLRDGKSYAMVDYDSVNMRPRIRLHKLDDGNSGIAVHRDPSDPETILFANRYFYSSIAQNGSTIAATSTSGIPRYTAYLPHEIRKYIMSKGGTWQPHMDEGDAGWPIPWVDMEGMPLGINIFEFENPGGSELRDVIGLQNGVNKSWIDLIAASDGHGFPMMSIEHKDDAMTDFNAADDSNIEGADELLIAPGRALETWGGTTVKRIPSADLAPMIETIWAMTMAISSVSKVPHHNIKPLSSAANMSGETLRQIEAPLVKKITEKQTVLGQSWVDVFQMAHKLESVFGRASMDDELSINMEWTDPRIKDSKSDAETASIHQGLGVPNDEVFMQLGYSPEQIASWGAARRQEQAAQIANIAGAIRVNDIRSQQQTNPIENGRI